MVGIEKANNEHVVRDCSGVTELRERFWVQDIFCA